MALTQPSLAPGFDDPVHDARSAFRTLMAAMSEPGIVHTLAPAPRADTGLPPAAVALLLTVADYETPLWLPKDLAIGAAGAHLRFHCAVPLVDEPGQAAFAVLPGLAPSPSISAFNPGTDRYPDRSATVLILCHDLTGGPAVRLSGPGIRGHRTIAPSGLRPGLWTELAANHRHYPLGVDTILVAGSTLLALPRSTAIEVV